MLGWWRDGTGVGDDDEMKHRVEVVVPGYTGDSMALAVCRYLLSDAASSLPDPDDPREDYWRDEETGGDP